MLWYLTGLRVFFKFRSLKGDMFVPGSVGENCWSGITGLEKITSVFLQFASLKGKDLWFCCWQDGLHFSFHFFPLRKITSNSIFKIAYEIYRIYERVYQISIP